MSTGSVEQEMAELVVEIGQDLTNNYVNSEYAEPSISSISTSTEYVTAVQCRRFASCFMTF
jgi:hypothetical protein